ncbi:MAG: flagellar assembly protein FliW [Thermoleophilia bacterium]
MSTADTAATPIAVHSQALGAIEIAPETILTVCEPLAGFPDCAAYAFVDHVREDGRASATVFWLQAVERPFHAFVVTDPWGVHPEYAPEISDADAADLGLESFEDARVFAILTVPRNPSDITVNLRAPVVVNMALRRAKQVVLLNDEYHTRHLMNDPSA